MPASATAFLRFNKIGKALASDLCFLNRQDAAPRPKKYELTNPRELLVAKLGEIVFLSASEKALLLPFPIQNPGSQNPKLL